jgi:hypothetical protein
VVESGAFDGAAHGYDYGAVGCPAGKRALGGGAEVTSPTVQWIAWSHPSTDGTAWNVAITNTDGVAHYFFIWATCAAVG